jgi:hypothetical protein
MGSSDATISDAVVVVVDDDDEDAAVVVVDDDVYVVDTTFASPSSSVWMIEPRPMSGTPGAMC